MGISSWVIPPQAEQDKFVARDTAISVLAHIAWLDSYPFPSPPNATAFPTSTCSALYAAYDNPPSGFTDTSLLYATLFGQNGMVYPPPPASNEHPGHSRLAFETNTLRAAGQLLHDLVRENVYSDLSGAENQAESQADPLGGQALAWGFKNPPTPYNSIGHAIRVLTGRWELDTSPPATANAPAALPLEPDPACMGVSQLDLISLADPGTQARANYATPSTTRQATAAGLFESSGLVVMDSALPSADLRSLLTTQLVANGAKAQGVSPTTYAASSAGTALTTILGGLSDSDLANGAQRTRTSFSLMTGVATGGAEQDLATAGTNHGMTPTTLPGVGVAIAGGVPSGQTAADATARAGAMMVASQCFEDNGSPQLLFDEGSVGELAVATIAPTTPTTPPSSNAATAERWMRQDVFAIAQSLRSRLVKMREYEDQSMPTGPMSPADAVARAAAISELGAWAGAGRAVLQIAGTYIPPNDKETAALLDLEGIDLSTFGATAPADLANTIRLVVGDPVAAECAAGLPNASCSASTVAAATWVPAYAQDLTPTADSQKAQRARFGTTGSYVRLSFRFDASAPDQITLANANSILSSQPVYVVATKYNGKPTGVGAVLGAIRLPQPTSTQPPQAGQVDLMSAVTISPMRDELLYDTVGLGAWVGAAPPQAGSLSIAASPQYCIDGIPRNIFVPLENDLTNDSNSYENSWQHYLSLATEAATRADSIGQTWISVGFDETMTQESAGEQLIPTTGSPTNVSDISVDQHGNLIPGPSNGALNSVLNQPMLDIVFFGTDPLANVTASANTTGQAARLTAMNNLICVSSTPHGICKRLKQDSSTVLQLVDPGSVASYSGNTDPHTVTYSYLNLVKTTTNTSSCTWSQTCAPLLNSVTDLKTVTPGAAFSSDTFSGAFGTSSTSSCGWTPDPSGLQGKLAAARMTVDMQDHWTVVVDGETIMDSDPPNPGPWPGCLSTGCDWTNPLTSGLNQLFRRCSSVLDLQATLGKCEGDANNSPASELNALRWRVEGTLWLLDAMTGGIAEGAFSSPVPAVNLVGTPAAGASIAAFFENGEFDTSTVPYGVPNFGPGFSSTTALGTTAADIGAITPAFMQWGSDVADILPNWLQQIYSPQTATMKDIGANYIHILGATGSIPAGDTDLTQNGIDGFFQSTMSHMLSSPNYLTSADWQSLAVKLNGATCGSPTGPITGTGATGLTTNSWQALIASIKTAQRFGSAMASPDAPGGVPYPNTVAVGIVWQWSTFLGGQWISSFPGFEGAAGRTVTPQSGWFDESPVYAFDLGINGHAGNADEFYSTNEWYAASHTAPPPADQGFHSDVVQGAWNYSLRDVSSVTPEQRMRRALNSGAPNGDCGAAWEFTQAVALGCMIDQQAELSAAQIANPPSQLQSTGDVTALGVWLQAQMNQLNAGFGTAYVSSIPAVAVAALNNPSGSTSGAGGQYGTDVQSVTSAIQNVVKTWNTMINDGTQLGIDIQQTSAAIALIDDEQTVNNENLFIEKLNTENAALETVASAAMVAKTFFDVDADHSLNLGQIVSNSAALEAYAGQLVLDGFILDAISKVGQEGEQVQADKVQGAFLTLTQQLSTTSLDFQNGLVQLNQDIGAINGAQLSLQTDRSSAAYYAGKAAGLGVWNCGSTSAPAECTSHVNTVLNRQYAGYELRYEAALREAKASAYIARLAIEQRIGMRLSDITTPVGPLAAPSTWADDVCSLTGISYTELSQEEGLDAGTTAQRDAVNSALAGQFANAFIGDYVQKLTDFVEFYNVSYPEQDADGTAVLSLREDMMQSSSSCLVPATNLLANSDRMYAYVAADPSATTPVVGWQVHQCALTDGTCMRPLSVGGLTLPADSPVGGVSWLFDGARPLPVEGIDSVNATAIAAPPGLVSSAVPLNPGSYALSWWDEALSSRGTDLTTSTVSFRVGVFDASWNPIASWTGLPADGATGWSARRVLSVTIATAGVYHVAFGASLANGGAGSVGIANPQFELLTSASGATAYEQTGTSGTVASVSCEATPGQLQSSFRYKCDPTGACYYQLASPITINSQTMTANGISIGDRLAVGNYNFRHIDVALNLVGTGVLDCSANPTPACYANGSVQYTLEHDADYVGVLGFDGAYRTFDFDDATIDHGNALAAERYITTPIGSADQALIQQPGILQTPFRGRPIDGIYNLKIYDSPALHFGQIQDVQLILNYHYWTPISTPGQN